MLTLHNVTKKYGTFTTLENIELEFGNGVHALLAPNGAGKTTLIKMLTTLIFPTKGDILWQGDDIIRLDSAYRDLIGYLPQEFGYYRNHSPKEFLLYISALKGLDKPTAYQRSDELIDLVGLSEVRDKKMRKFSGGMVQRVGIAQAMLNDPKILILDEPTAGLDPKERVRFRNLISSLSKDRIVILSTHIVSDIETIANRVIMFKNHRLYVDDPPAAIAQILQGKVYETESIQAIGAPHLELTEYQSDGKSMVRFVCDTDCSAIARVASPSLEDAFLYIYRDEVQ